MDFPEVSSVSSLAIYKRGGVSDQTDVRGTMLLDNVVRDVRFTFRSFRRTPLVALTIVTTVGLGLGLVAVVFTILNAYIFRVDPGAQPRFSCSRLTVSELPDVEPETFTRAAI